MRPSWFSSLLAVAIAAAPAQAPGFRVIYRLRVLERAGAETHLLATGEVSGPPETDVRLSLRSDSVDVESLLELFPEPDTVTLAGAFFTKRRAGRSRRGLPLWEQDSYRRVARLAWGSTAQLYPFGAARSGGCRPLWVEITVRREPAGGATRPTETVLMNDSALALSLEAVLRPRRSTVTLTLVRGDTASAPQSLDLIPDAPGGRRVTFVLGPDETRALDVSLVRPEPPTTGRDSALAVDAEVVCLRVTLPETLQPARIRCGRLNNVARRLPLTGRDTLVAAFAWPAAR